RRSGGGAGGDEDGTAAGGAPGGHGEGLGRGRGRYGQLRIGDLPDRVCPELSPAAPVPSAPTPVAAALPRGSTGTVEIDERRAVGAVQMRATSLGRLRCRRAAVTGSGARRQRRGAAPGRMDSFRGVLGHPGRRTAPR